jgi:hypothetical protein
MERHGNNGSTHHDREQYISINIALDSDTGWHKTDFVPDYSNLQEEALSPAIIAGNFSLFGSKGQPFLK